MEAVSGDMGRETGVRLFWLPLGAGGHSVRWNGRVFEALAARRERRAARDLYHSALEVVRADGARFVIEMTPAWGGIADDRGVVAEGAVGAQWLGRSRLFRYEIRCWRDGVIPDVEEAVAEPTVSRDPVQADRLLELVEEVPTATWGRDELAAGDMWNSNSLVAWLLARSGHDLDAIAMPAGGRAPGWRAGVVVAARATATPKALEVRQPRAWPPEASSSVSERDSRRRPGSA